MVAKRKQPQLVDLDAVLPRLCDYLNAHGAMRWPEMTRLGVPKLQHQAAIDRLRAAGFEDMAKLVRVPIKQQIRTALSERGQLPVKGLQNLLSGCAAKELLLSIDELVQSGAAIRVLRTKAEWLAPADADVLSADELQALNRSVAEWSKQTQQVKASRKRVLAIWRDDVRSLLESLGALGQSPRRRTSGSHDVKQRLRQIVQEQINPAVGLAFVPTVLDVLHMSTDQARALLLDEARSGHLELRPDSGTARFTEAELLAAPEGPDGSRLLWVRLLEENA